MVFMNLQKGGLNPLIPSVGINSDAWDEKMSSSMNENKNVDWIKTPLRPGVLIKVELAPTKPFLIVKNRGTCFQELHLVYE